MCEWVPSIIIGIATGLLSSWIVTASWQKKIDKAEQKRELDASKAEYKRDFYNTIQVLCRYLERIQKELEIMNPNGKAANIRRLIEVRPATPILSKALSDAGREKMNECTQLLYCLDKAANNDAGISEDKCNEYKWELLYIEYDLLKNQHSYLRRYEETIPEKTI